MKKIIKILTIMILFIILFTPNKIANNEEEIKEQQEEFRNTKFLKKF